MFNTIERLRDKPEHKKKIIALSGAFILTGLIATAWALTLPTKLGKTTAQEEGGDPSPLSSVQESFAAAFKGIQNEIDEFKKGWGNLQYQAQIAEQATPTDFASQNLQGQATTTQQIQMGEVRREE